MIFIYTIIDQFQHFIDDMLHLVPDIFPSDPPPWIKNPDLIQEVDPCILFQGKSFQFIGTADPADP